MAATLKSFILDESTRRYMEQAIELHQDPMVTADDLDYFCDLSDAEIKLAKLPDGDYGVIISADPENDTEAKVKLMNLADHQVIKESTINLSGIIETAILYSDDYAAANIADDPDKELSALEKMRSQPFSNMLAPYLDNNINFNTEFLELLDLLTHFIVQDKLVTIEDEADADIQKRLNDPLIKFIPPSNQLH